MHSQRQIACELRFRANKKCHCAVLLTASEIILQLSHNSWHCNANSHINHSDVYPIQQASRLPRSRQSSFAQVQMVPSLFQSVDGTID